MRFKTLRRSCIGAIIISMSYQAHADLFEPFSTSNLNPFIQPYAPPAASSANAPEKGSWELAVQTEFANHFTESNTTTESISIDGETHKATISISRGLTDRMALIIELPYISHDQGYFDNFIEGWHKFFGLPNGGREDVPTRRLRYLYSNTADNVQLSNSASGIGDVRLHVNYRLATSPTRQWSVRAGVKLPTGDEDELLGSGSTDVFASLHVNDDGLIRHPDWFVRAHLGVLGIGDGDVLEDQVEDWIVYGSGTLAFRFKDNISLKAQLDFHSAYFDSDLRELGDASAQLILGGTLHMGERTFLDISVSEDIVTDTAPDVVFQLGLRTNF